LYKLILGKVKLYSYVILARLMSKHLMRLVAFIENLIFYVVMRVDNLLYLFFVHLYLYACPCVFFQNTFTYHGTFASRLFQMKLLS